MTESAPTGEQFATSGLKDKFLEFCGKQFDRIATVILNLEAEINDEVRSSRQHDQRP